MAAATQPIIVRSGGGGGLLPIILVGGAAAAGYFFYLKPYLDKVAATNQLKADQATTVNTSTVIDKATGKPKTVAKMYDLRGKPITSANLATIASDIYAGLHPGWYKPTDQERVVRAFLNTPWGRVQEMEGVYLKNHGENLRATMVEKLSDENWIKVKNWFK